MKKLIALILILAVLLPVSALAGDVEDAVCGRWCFYWDTRPMNEKYNFGKPMMSFLILNYDLYLYEDGTLSFTSVVIDKNGTFKLSYPAADGLWTAADADHITIRTMSSTYQGLIDENGRLLVYMVEDIPYPFLKVPSYDFFAENPN